MDLKENPWKTTGFGLFFLLPIGFFRYVFFDPNPFIGLVNFEEFWFAVFPKNPFERVVLDGFEGF